MQARKGLIGVLASVGTALFRISIIAVYGSLALLVARRAIRNH